MCSLAARRRTVVVKEKIGVRIRQSRPGGGEVWVETNRCLKRIGCALVVRLEQVRALEKGEPTQIGVVGFGAIGGSGGYLLFFGTAEFGVQLLRDGGGDFAFHGKGIIELAVVTLSPD